VFSIVDELVVILQSMFGTFEGNGKDGPLANGMGTKNVNDEDSGADLIGLQKVCQPLYPSAHSTKLATIMLLMNIYTIHKVNNKFVNELLSLLHKYLCPFPFKYVSCKNFNKEGRPQLPHYPCMSKWLHFVSGGCMQT
jgi:hypothetical protein